MCVSPYWYSIETMSVSRTVSEIFSVKEWHDLETGVGVDQRHWKWSHSIDHVRLSIGRHCKYSSILYRFWVIWRCIISWPWNLAQRSLKCIQTGTIRNLRCGFVFAFNSNYGRIFNCLWDIQRQRIAWLESWVMGCSRSLKMAPFDRPYTGMTFCWSAID